jgi:lysophospholipase L1-like esterase
MMKKAVLIVAMVAALFVLVYGHKHYQQRLNNTAEAATISVEKGQQQQKQVVAAASPWENKNWYAIGDSLTSNNKYQNLVKNSLLLKSVQTDASPSQQMKTMANGVTKDKLKDINLITVFGGTNDYGNSRALGKQSDDKSKDTFYGDLQFVISKLSNLKNKDAKIVFFTPLIRGDVKGQPQYPKKNSAGYKLEDYVQAIKDVCKQHSIPVVDLFTESGLSKNNLKTYTTDQLNLNDAGYEMVSKVMAKDLATVQP